MYSAENLSFKIRFNFVILFCLFLFAYITRSEQIITYVKIISLFVPILILFNFYTTIKQKYFITLLAAGLWAIFSIQLAQRWISDLSNILGYPLAVLSIYGIAIIPGFVNCFLLISIFLDKRPGKKKVFDTYPPITVLIAAYNEQESIENTIRSVINSDYTGKVSIIVANDGSTDLTADIVNDLSKTYPQVSLVNLQKNSGKSSALNTGLSFITTDLVVTIDADSTLHYNALTNIVLRYLNDPKGTAAVAGQILSGNPSLNFITRLQEWDYFIGISGVKRMQSLYQGTLVAQGAFSLYETKVLKQIGGWKHTVGEDIVLTWEILSKGHRVGYAEDACVLTQTPTSFKQFFKQRQRWSRGVVEAFKENWPLLFKARLTTLFIWWNLLFVYTDLAYLFVFLPGVVATAFGYFWIAGPYTLLILPIAIAINIHLYLVQANMLKKIGITPSRRWGGFALYCILYSIILLPACVSGYFKEIFLGRKKSWGTK